MEPKQPKSQYEAKWIISGSTVYRYEDAYWITGDLEPKTLHVHRNPKSKRYSAFLLVVLEDYLARHQQERVA